MKLPKILILFVERNKMNPKIDSNIGPNHIRSAIEKVGSGIRLWVLFHCLLKAFTSHHKQFKKICLEIAQVVSQQTSFLREPSCQQQQ